ncbi:epithelial sodium channel subunit gamma-like isoform X2 [Lepeophtheirus salmonis]|uniref:epithelial sodium channel subunit gamma-like isoform X2 n=1 Tax=Lepeophtheirus salmonis TaxID=72036 RepID=UPI001AE13A6B|nr:amiloride-sensitive sodium channel subunit gamma-like [Lepeophtheirus salmonis]
MIDCSFKGSSCYHEKFWRVMSIPCCGNCFTFNTIFNDQDNDTLKKVSLTGIMNGLSLELYLNQDNYMQKGLSRKAGATVVIHDGAVLPQIEEFGHQIPPKTATSIALEKKISKLMPHPYETDCINYWSDTKYFNYIVKDIQHIYSLESCQKLCIQIELIDRCNCQHVHLYTSLLNETYITDKDGTPLRTCSSIPSDKNADYKCYMNVQREHDEGVQTCDCKNPCLSVAYRMSVATSDWPSDYYMPIILEKLNESRIISPVDSLLRKRDYVRADVFFESLNVLSVKTNPKYNIDSFFAGLGGALSFYMGIAIIMVFEALELIFDILVTAMKELGQIERKEPK